MINFNDTSFWLSVAVGAVILGLFMRYIFGVGKPRKRKYEVINQVRCKNEADEIKAMLKQCHTTGDLDRLETKVYQFYTDNYEIVGIPFSLKLLKTLNKAIDERRKEILKPV